MHKSTHFKHMLVPKWPGAIFLCVCVCVCVCVLPFLGSKNTMSVPQFYKGLTGVKTLF